MTHSRAGDPASVIGDPDAVVYPYMMGWTPWYYPPNDQPLKDIQTTEALIDLKATHAVSDIWVNHYQGTPWGYLRLFADSPFDDKPVWEALYRTSSPVVTSCPLPTMHTTQ